MCKLEVPGLAYSGRWIFPIRFEVIGRHIIFP